MRRIASNFTVSLTMPSINKQLMAMSLSRLDNRACENVSCIFCKYVL